MKKALSVLALFVLGVGAGLIYVSSQRGGSPPPTPNPTSSAPASGVCAAHGVPPSDCPWCDKGLIESKGQCGGHGVPEALCSRCNAALIPGFKAGNDWCAGHGLPESQCLKCQGGDLPPGESPRDLHNTGPEGAFCGAHQIAEADCPWCDKSLIEKKGLCGGHGVPEALCSRCNAALIPGFKAENDWCAGHGLPESQCLKCQGGDLPPGESPRDGHNAGPEGAFCGVHQIAEADCPWCDKSLIEKKGHCGGHGVPEALCSRCNAALIPGFKAEKDWCAGHGLPESQCKKCQAGDLPPGERRTPGSR